MGNAHAHACPQDGLPRAKKMREGWLVAGGRTADQREAGAGAVATVAVARQCVSHNLSSRFPTRKDCMGLLPLHRRRYYLVRDSSSCRHR